VPPKPALENKQADEILEVLEAVNPAMADRLLALRQTDPEQFQVALSKVGDRIMSLVKLKKSDPEGFAVASEEYRVQRELDELLQRCGSDLATIEANRTQLRELLDQQHSARIRKQEREVSQLESHVTNIRKTLSDQSQSKDVLIQQRFKELTTGKLAKRPDLPDAASPPEDMGTPADPAAFNDAQVALALDVIGAARPDLAERLIQLRAKDDKAFRSALGKFGPRLRLLMNKRKQDPRAFDLQLADHRLDLLTLDLADKWRKARPEDRPSIEPDLVNAIQQQLDARHVLLTHELSRVDARIRRMRQELDDRRKNRQRLVDQSLQRIIDSATRVEASPKN
jgi:hypothetical protein